MAERPYSLHEPQYAPGRWEMTRPSMHRTDAHRSTLHGRILPMQSDTPWWMFWRY